MQRVRIGLTGLAFVFILVLLGAIFASPTSEDSAANVAVRQLNPGQAPPPSTVNEALPKEPLAELGMAPGNADENDSAPSGETGAQKR